MEGLGDLGVALDEEVLLDGHRLVALVDLVSHPGPEDVLEHGVADVGEPLLRHLRDLLALREVQVHNVVRRHEVGDLLNGKLLVLRDGDVAHVFADDPPLLTHDQVLQEVDRDALCRKRYKGLVERRIETGTRWCCLP